MKVVISKKFSFHLNKVHFGPIFARKKFLVINSITPITSFRKTIIFLKNISGYAILLV